LQEQELVGMITETDLFKIFLELLGVREAGVRLTVLVADVPGELAKLTSIIRNLNGNIIAMVQVSGESSSNREVTLKVAGVDQQVLADAVEPEVLKLIDIRTS
jgi:acetoin utilization protein AcuB